MNTGSIIAIIMISIVVVVVVGVLVYVINVTSHNNYCTNWFNSLEQQRVQLENQLFSDPTQYNTEISDYNKECYY
jgi:flagellar basal body-associated protein FliL